MIAVPGPPFGGGMQIFQIFGDGALDDAEVFRSEAAGAEFSGNGGTVEDDGFQVLWPPDSFRRFTNSVELSFHR